MQYSPDTCIFSLVLNQIQNLLFQFSDKRVQIKRERERERERARDRDRDRDRAKETNLENTFLALDLKLLW